MYTTRRHRHATRWNRRLAFALVVGLLLAASWRTYRDWQRAQPAAPEPLTQQA